MQQNSGTSKTIPEEERRNIVINDFQNSKKDSVSPDACTTLPTQL